LRLFDVVSDNMSDVSDMPEICKLRTFCLAHSDSLSHPIILTIFV